MLEFLQRLFNHEKDAAAADSLTQVQREALLDLLIMAEFTDSYIGEAEVRFVRSEAERHPWESTLTIENYYDASVTRTRSASVSAEAREDYLLDIIQRLKTPAACKQAYDLCSQLIKAGGEVNEAENTFLRELWQKLPRD
jgi:uncharacterized tellurite resistance protein B-like protein